MENQQQTRIMRPGLKSPLELVGFLQQLSSDVAEGDTSRVFQTAVEIPVLGLGADRAVLLRRNSDTSWVTVATCNCPAALEDLISSDGPVREAIISQSPVVVVDALALPAEQRHTYSSLGIRSLVCIPVLCHKQPEGALVCICDSPHSFTVWQMELMNIIANNVATVLRQENEKQASREMAASQRQYLGSLYKVARTITSTLELNRVLCMVLEHTAPRVKSDVCGLLLYDTTSGHLKAAVGNGIPHGMSDHYAELIKPAERLQPSRQRPLVINDMRTHPLYAGSQIAATLGLRSAVIMPLVVKHRRVGFLATYSRQPRAFSQHDVRLLAGMSELAAIAIDNACLYEQQLGIAGIARKQLSPRHPKEIPGFSVGARYIPARTVGGDYYDILGLDDRRFGIAIADVSGKSISAASHISMCRHSLHALARRIHSPAELLSELNRLTYAETEAETFISMFYGILDTEDKTLTFAVAGHEPALILRAQTSHIESHHAPGILLGIVPDATYGQATTYLKVGDVLLLYTDGLIDLLSEDHQVAIAEVKTFLAECGLMEAQEIADNIHHLANNRTAGRPADDVAILTLKSK